MLKYKKHSGKCDDEGKNIAGQLSGHTSVLFFSHENLNRDSGECPVFTDFIFQKSFIRLLHILWQVAIKGKRWEMSRQLCCILDSDIFSLGARWGIILDSLQHDAIEL